MIVRPPELALNDREAVLAARLEFADPGRAPFELRFTLPAELADRADRSANPFMPLATLLAARLGEDLIVEGAASPRLRAGCDRAAALFAAWWEYRPPRIDVAEEATPPALGDGVGVLYSRGVDTSATLVRSLRGEIPERVTHLLAGDAIDWTFSDEVAREIWAGHELAAAELDLPLVRLRSNAREILRGTIGWPRSYGTAYLGAALAAGPLLAHVLTGATQPLQGAEPRGSRWDLDPLWSTEHTAVRQDAAEMSRAERTAIVATDEVALRWLKVCWQGRRAGNCGRCLKCLRTMTELRIAGVPDGTVPFDAPLEAAAIRAAPLGRLGLQVTPQFARSIPRELDGIREAWLEKAREAERAKRRRRRDERLLRVRRRVRRARRPLRRALRRRRRALRRRGRSLRRRIGRGTDR